VTGAVEVDQVERLSDHQGYGAARRVSLKDDLNGPIDGRRDATVTPD
jgi:hypothetical protein